MTPAHITALCQPERIEVYIGLGLAALVGYGVGALWPWFKRELSEENTLQWYGRDQETGAEVRRRLFGGKDVT